MKKYSLITAALSALALALTGCGGASHSGSPAANTLTSNAPTQAQARGQVSLTIKWPAVPAATPGAKARLVPEASQSVTIALSANGQAVGTPQTVARPSGQTTSTATFTNVPSGSVTVAATAYPTTNGSGTALATGSVVVQVTPGTPAQASVTMGSTIDHLTITPAGPSVAVGATTPLTATAYDAAGDVVLTTPTLFIWASLDPTKATVDANGIVAGVGVGTPTITVTDGESGKTGSLTVSVTASGGGGGGSGGLANSPWPKFRGGAMNTGTNPRVGSGATGALKWRYATGNDVFSSPALGADGTVYVGSDDGNIYAIH